MGSSFIQSTVRSEFVATRQFQTSLKRAQLSRVPIGSKSGNKLSKFDSTIEFSAGKAAVLFVVVGGLSYYIFEKQKKKMDDERRKEETRGYGKPNIGGGKFTLIDQDGNKFTEENLLGQFSLVYFGFSHCPDICPDELDKLGVWLDRLEKDNITIKPIFITCDPARDSSKVLKDYLTDFHAGIVGLTGSWDDIKSVCKQYRVYFSTPPNVKAGQDYLVDHSVFFYLMDPEGKFVEALGLNYDEETGYLKIKKHISEYISEDERERGKKRTGWFS